MTSVLKISLLGNLISIVALTILLTRPGRLIPPPSIAVPVQTQTRLNDFQSSASRNAFAGFSWCQLESSDYPTYVRNLRQIGCPEQTIADIIRADVHSLYTRKRSEPGLIGAGSSAWSRVEEAQVINSLLGIGAAQLANKLEGNDRTPVMPLVFRDPDPTLLHLDPEQEAALGELRAQFVSEIGGLNQDPATPAYAQRWHVAQPETDRLLRGMIGVNAFMQLQNQDQ